MSRLYADIIVDISQEKLDRTFQYEIPEHLQDDIQIGTKVRVPFGNGGREITGYVIDITGQPKVEASRMKQILGPESQGIPIESRLISLASWIAKNYGSTMNQALKTVLPDKDNDLLSFCKDLLDQFHIDFRLAAACDTVEQCGTRCL